MGQRIRPGFDPVMIQHHHIQPQRAGFFERRAAGRAAIHGDDQFRAFFFQLGEGRRGGTITFADAVGNINPRHISQAGEKIRQQSG